MRIAYITDVDLSSNDAPPIHVREIINNLSKMRNRILLIGPKSNLFKVRAKKIYLKIPSKSFLRSIIFNLKLFFMLPFYIKKNNIEVIYTRQSGTLISPAIISKIMNKLYITEINGNIEDEIKSNNLKDFYIKIAKSVEKYCYKNAHRVISVTEKIKQSLVIKYNIPEDKIVFLENGVDPNKFKPIRIDLNKKDKIIGYIGNFASWQGLEYLIEAISIVKKLKGDVSCIIVGDGPDRVKLEKLSKDLGVDNNVIFKGRVNHNLITKYINSFYLCVAPKKKILENGGGSPFKLYEYASCGKPIISTKIHGILEFIRENKCGIVVEPNNSKALADAIIKLLDNPKLAEEMGKNGRKAILNGYSWKSVAERTQKVIEDAIKENRK